MKSKFIVFSILVSVVFMSCTKDDDTSPYLYEISVSDNYISPNDNMYIWFTDKAGDIIFESQLKNGQQINVPKPQNYSGERYSLHLFKDYENSSKFLNTFKDIKPGTLNLKYYDFYNSGELLGKTSVNFFSLPFHDYYFASNYKFGSNLQKLDFNVYKNNRLGYVYLQNKYGNGYYSFIDNLKEDTQISLTGSDFRSDMTHHNVSIPSEQDINYCQADIYQYENKYDFLSRSIYLYYRNFKNNELTDGINFDTPTKSPFSNTFKSSFRFNYYTFSKDYYSYTQYGAIPTQIKKIDAGFLNNELDYFDLQLQTTGTFDLVFFVCYYNKSGGSYYWNTWSEKGDDIIFPQLPNYVMQNFSDFTMENLIINNTVINAYLTDRDNTADFDEVIDRYFFRKGKGYLDGLGFVKEVRRIY